MGWKEGGCEDWLFFFYTLVFVANAALIMMLMVGFFVFCFFFVSLEI